MPDRVVLVTFRGTRIDNGQEVVGNSILQFMDNGVLSVYIASNSSGCTCTHDGDDNIEVVDLRAKNNRFYEVDVETLIYEFESYDAEALQEGMMS